MKKITRILGVAIIALSAIKCTPPTELEFETENLSFDQSSLENLTLPKKYKVLPVGDSRVSGHTELFESYRYELWKKLMNFEVKFDFIGPEHDLKEYPPYLNRDFDPDHGAQGGARTTHIIDNMTNHVYPLDADILLLGIGGNDLSNGSTVEETINNIQKIIDNFQFHNKHIIIFLEQIAPARSEIMTPENIATLKEFHKQIAQMARKETLNGQEVIAINMAQGWKDYYLADNVHYNIQGSKVIASRYFKAFDNYFNY